MVSIREALAAAPGTGTGTGTGTITVDGLVIDTGREVLLAEALAESFPPQPGGAVLVLVGVDPADLPGATTAGGVTWVDRPQRVTGSIDGEVLTVAGVEPLA